MGLRKSQNRNKYRKTSNGYLSMNKEKNIFWFQSKTLLKDAVGSIVATMVFAWFVLMPKFEQMDMVRKSHLDAQLVQRVVYVLYAGDINLINNNLSESYSKYTSLSKNVKLLIADIDKAGIAVGGEGVPGSLGYILSVSNYILTGSTEPVLIIRDSNYLEYSMRLHNERVNEIRDSMMMLNFYWILSVTVIFGAIMFWRNRSKIFLQ